MCYECTVCPPVRKKQKKHPAFTNARVNVVEQRRVILPGFCGSGAQSSFSRLAEGFPPWLFDGEVLTEGGIRQGQRRSTCMYLFKYIFI